MVEGDTNGLVYNQSCKPEIEEHRTQVLDRTWESELRSKSIIHKFTSLFTLKQIMSMPF